MRAHLKSQSLPFFGGETYLKSKFAIPFFYYYYFIRYYTFFLKLAFYLKSAFQRNYDRLFYSKKWKNNISFFYEKGIPFHFLQINTESKWILRHDAAVYDIKSWNKDSIVLLYDRFIFVAKKVVQSSEKRPLIFSQLFL